MVERKILSYCFSFFSLFLYKKGEGRERWDIAWFRKLSIIHHQHCLTPFYLVQISKNCEIVWGRNFWKKINHFFLPRNTSGDILIMVIFLCFFPLHPSLLLSPLFLSLFSYFSFSFSLLTSWLQVIVWS